MLLCAAGAAGASTHGGDATPTGPAMTHRMMLLVIQVGLILFVARMGNRLFERLRRTARSPQGVAMPDRPNLLVLMTDQWRWDWLGAAEAAFLRTPNIDRLAARGVRFSQCCTNAPVCAPARIALAAGLQPVRMGALDNVAFLPTGVTTCYQRLRDHGYRVGCVGKLDLAKPDGYNGLRGDRPCVYGWGFTHPEEVEGKMHAGRFPTPQGPYGHWLAERRLYEAFHADYAARAEAGWSADARDSVLPTDAFADCYIGRRSAEWIREIPDDFPWHLFVSFVGPHNPFDPPTEYADRWRDAEVPAPVERNWEGKPACHARKDKGFSPEHVAVTRRQYAAAIEAIDDQVGQILDALEDRGWLEDTVILFSSDHGEMLGDHGCYTKAMPYEGCLRVPLIAAGPGIAAGEVCEAPVELIDLNPTLCELAGLDRQENLDAWSFAPVLRGETSEHRSECVSMLRHFRLVRTERYKFVENINDLDELYDLRADPGEQRNIAPGNPGLCNNLRKVLGSRYTEGKWRR